MYSFPAVFAARILPRGTVTATEVSVYMNPWWNETIPVTGQIPLKASAAATMSHLIYRGSQDGTDLNHCTSALALQSYLDSVLTVLPVLQVATPSAQNRQGQAPMLASGHDDGSQRDLLSYTARRQTKLIYSDSELHLQVGTK